MARRAELRLSLLDELTLERLRTVNAVAGRAGQVAPLVAAAFPRRVIPPVVTRQADLVDLAGLHLLDLADVPARVVVDVSLTGAVTGFAAVGCHRRPGVLCLPVRRAFDRCLLIGMTVDALVRAGIAALRSGWLRLGTGCGRRRFGLRTWRRRRWFRL